MGVRINADRVDTAAFPPQRPAPEPQAEEPPPVQPTTETDEAEETRDAAETREVAEAEEADNDRTTQQAPAPAAQTDLPPTPFGPTVPGGNLNIVA